MHSNLRIKAELGIVYLLSNNVAQLTSSKQIDVSLLKVHTATPYQAVNTSVTQSAAQSVSQFVSWSMSHLVSQSVTHSACQPVGYI